MENLDWEKGRQERQRKALENHARLSRLFKEDRLAFQREQKRMIDEVINSIEDEGQRNRLRAFQESWEKKMREGAIGLSVSITISWYCFEIRISHFGFTHPTEKCHTQP